MSNGGLATRVTGAGGFVGVGLPLLFLRKGCIPLHMQVLSRDVKIRVTHRLCQGTAPLAELGSSPESPN